MSCIGNILPDQIRSSSVSWGATSKTISIGFTVNNIDGTEFNYLTDAIADLGITIGSVCPADSNCLATSFESKSLDGQANNAAQILVNYVGFDYYGSPTQDDDNFNLSYSYNAALDNDQTNAAYLDPNTPLLVYWWQNPALIGNFAKASGKQGCTVNVLKPYTTKTVSFFYVVPDGFPDDVISSYQSFVGFSNSDVWDGGKAKTWLVMSCSATPVGLPQQVRVDITFMYRPQTWMSWAFFKDVTSGGSPDPCLKNIADPGQTIANTGSNGARGFFSYGTINFLSSFGFE